MNDYNMSDDEDYAPRPKLDKGKGKMVHVELPAELWERIFQLYYDKVCDDWQTSSQMTNGLNPLLISHLHYEAALPVLYAHPHVSEKSIFKFIRDVQKPALYNSLDSKVPLVRHLTIRPSPIDTKASPATCALPNTSWHLADLTSLFPTLRSLTLRETFVDSSQDVLNVFRALSLTSPEKLRLEVRMWKVSDLARCDDVLISTRPNTHGQQTRPAPPPVNLFGPNREMTLRSIYSSNYYHAAWRDALYTGTEVDLPLSRTEPEANAPQAVPNAIPAPPTIGSSFMLPPAPVSGGLARRYRPHQTATSTPEARADSRAIDFFCGLLFSEYGMPIDSNTRAMAEIQAEEYGEVGVEIDHRRAHDIVASNGFERRGDRDRAGRVRTLSQFRYEKAAANARDRNTAAALLAQALEEHSAGSASTSAAKAEDPPVADNVPSNETTGPSGTRINHEPSSVQTESSRIGEAEELKEPEDEMLQEGIRASRALARETADRAEGSSTGLAAAGPSYQAAVPPLTNKSFQYKATSPQKTPWPSDHPDHPVPEVPAGQDNTHHPNTSSISEDGRQCPTGVLVEMSTDKQPIEPPGTWDEKSGARVPWTLLQPTQVAGMTTDANHDGSAWSESAVAGSPLVESDAPALSAEARLPEPTEYGSDDDESDDELYERVLARPRAPLFPEPWTTQATSSTSRAFAPLPANPFSAPQTQNPRGGNEATADLPTNFRALLRTLLEGTWAGRLQAFSFVALDPLASMIVRSPRLDLWPHVAVPHIRVHLPRGVNSLAVFMGAKEDQRHRDRRARAGVSQLADPAGTGSDVNEGAVEVDDLVVIGAVAGAPAPAGAAPTYEDSRPTPVNDFIVGGDGFGGDLVHPENRLFEIEVNTIKEMTDELWTQAGSQLPPQVCRILIGQSDWAEVTVGTRVAESQHAGYSPPTTAEHAPVVYTLADFDSASEGGDEDEADWGSDDAADAGGGSYDAEAARAQAERLAQRKRDREQLEKDE